MASQSWLEEAATSVLRTETVFPTYHFYNNTVEMMYDDAEHSYFRFDGEGNRIEIPSVTTILKVAIDKSPALMAWAVKLCAVHITENLFNADGTMRQLSTEEFTQLVDAAKGQHKVKLDEAGDIGKVAHDFLERIAKDAIEHTDGYVTRASFLPQMPNGYVQGSDVALELRTSLARNCVVAGLNWIKRHNVRFVHAERKIYSKAYDFAGTTDGVAYVDSCDDISCCRGESFKARLAVLDYKSSNELRESYAWQCSAYQFALIEELGLDIKYRYVLRLGKTDGRFEPWMIDSKFFNLDIDTFLNALKLYRSLEEIKARRSEDKRALRALIKERKDAEKAKLAEETKLAKLAEKEAKAAIKAEEKAERDAAKKAAKEAAKPVSGPVLVVPESTNTPLSKLAGPEMSPFEKQYFSEDEPEPGIAQTVQASAERTARFWAVSSTYTSIGRTI
jgi:hypothetical protein